MGALKIRELRLVGSGRDYGVSFVDETDRPLPMAVIAGQISTGKTSVLEFIAYCLGARDFPHHPEVRTRVRVALLEIDLNGGTFVIERAASQTPSRVATLHSCALDDLEELHQRTELAIDPPADPSSVSSFLLGQLGLANVMLKEAPSQAASGADRLSVRDMLRFVLIENSDLDDRNLLLESRPHVVRLKHEQVIDLMFGAHDNTAVSLAAEVKALEADVSRREVELATLERFFEEQEVPPTEVLTERATQIEADAVDLSEQLAVLEQDMQAEARFGDEQRSRYREAGERARSLLNASRELTSQHDRLVALAAQYDQDIKKLVFASDAKRLFDPLVIEVCPWCLQPVSGATLVDDECSICHQALGSESGDGVDLEKELRALKRRYRELAAHIEDVERTRVETKSALGVAGADQRRAQAEFDRAMEGRFSPYLAERDQLLDDLAGFQAASGEIARLTRMHESRNRRREELGRDRQRLQELALAQAEAETSDVSREEVVGDLSIRFAEILGSFQFPKLAEPELDGRFVPWVRGVRYDQLGSAGAMTLVSLAWYLAVLERSEETGGSHPGLLMVDSPQKNLVPASGRAADDYQAPLIAQSVYEHLIEWAASPLGANAQLLVVDNDPPQSAAPYVVARFSGDPASPPYGLIEDATD